MSDYTGNLTNNPELRFTQNGRAVARFDIAMNRKFTDANGQQVEDTTYLKVNVWGQQAENAAKSLSKGTRVNLDGYLQEHKWETEAGEPRSRIELTATEVSPSLRFATAQITRNPSKAPASDAATGPDSTASANVSQQAEHAVASTPTVPSVQSVPSVSPSGSEPATARRSAGIGY